MREYITSSKENSEECWGEFTNRNKTGQYPQGNNQLHSEGNNLHFYGQESFALYKFSASLSQFFLTHTTKKKIMLL